MNWKQLITADPRILRGALRITGSVIPVTAVLGSLADVAALARARIVPIPT